MQHHPFLSHPYRGPVLCVCAMLVALGTASCVELPPTPKPDYVIRVKTQNGKTVAIPPTCASWNTDVVDPFDNQPLPQFGCATARNLAMMVERPADLVGEPRPMGPPDSVTTLGATVRYRHNQTRGFVWPSGDPSQIAITTAPVPNSALNGAISGSPDSSSKSGP